MPPVHVKGQAFIGFQSSVAKLYGREAMPKIKSLLSKDLQRALENNEIVSVGWYPIGWYGDLHDAARRAYGPAISRQIARDAARSDVTTIYRFILKFFSPQTLMNQSSRVFRLFCDAGRCTVEKTEPQRAHLSYAGCDGANRGFWDNVIGGSETLVELCGGNGVETRVTSGGGDDDATMRCEVAWKVSPRRATDPV
jgi:hypothetical protein